MFNTLPSHPNNNSTPPLVLEGHRRVGLTPFFTTPPTLSSFGTQKGPEETVYGTESTYRDLPDTAMETPQAVSRTQSKFYQYWYKNESFRNLVFVYIKRKTFQSKQSNGGWKIKLFKVEMSSLLTILLLGPCVKGYTRWDDTGILLTPYGRDLSKVFRVS